METKFELHPDLKDASLEKVCEMAKKLKSTSHMSRITAEEIAFDLSYMLEYLRLNFDLVPKK